MTREIIAQHSTFVGRPCIAPPKMAETFIGLSVDIALADGANVRGTVAQIEQNGLAITLRGEGTVRSGLVAR